MKFICSHICHRLKGSTLLVMGTGVNDGQWGIVGGTGYFTMAQGYINKTEVRNTDTGSVIELDIYATFRTAKARVSAVPTKKLWYNFHCCNTI